MRWPWNKNKIVSKDVDLVGRNLLASFVLKTIVHETHSKIKWWAHQDDQELGGAWVYIPDKKMVNVPLDEAIFIDPKRVYFFLNNRRIPLHGFLTHRFEPHLAVRRKTYAISLWNDLTPLVWKNNRPDPKWFSSNPLSLPNFDWAGGVLVPRSKSLRSLEKYFTEHNVAVQNSDDYICKRIPQNRILGKFSLLDKNKKEHAINGKCIWLSPTATPEGQATDYLARWVTYSAQVDPRYVSALPLFSVWLSESEQNLFFESGLLESFALKRVFVIPQEDAGTSLLQIQILKLNPIDKLFTPGKRVDEFLWKTCPFLEDQKLNFLSNELIEDVLFENPLPQYQGYFLSLKKYWPASMGKIEDDLRPVIKSLT